MYATDEPVEVALLCDNTVMKSVVDKFGMSIVAKSAGKQQFRVKVKVCVGPTFFSWVFGAGGKIIIESPECVIEEYREMLLNAVKINKLEI